MQRQATHAESTDEEETGELAATMAGSPVTMGSSDSSTSLEAEAGAGAGAEPEPEGLRAAR